MKLTKGDDRKWGEDKGGTTGKMRSANDERRQVAWKSKKVAFSKQGAGKDGMGATGLLRQK